MERGFRLEKIDLFGAFDNPSIPQILVEVLHFLTDIVDSGRTCLNMLESQRKRGDSVEGIRRRLVGLRLSERGFPRHGYPVVSDGADVGEVTSGVVSPSLGIGVAMGYVPTELAAADTELGVRIRDKVIPAVVQRPPFYKEGSVRK